MSGDAPVVKRSERFFEAYVSNMGVVRTNNEDAYLARGDEGLWVVADGMGGFEDGQWASRALALDVSRAPLDGDLERDMASVSEAIRHANYVIFKESTDRQNRMGTTVVSLIISGGRFGVVWAGDSRLYLWRGGQLARVTRDHTQVRQLVEAGYLSPEDADSHPMGHVLARAVGVQSEVELEQVVGQAAPGDVFLLCSDGLAAVMSDPKIAGELPGATPENIVTRLLEKTLAGGAPDNVTLMAIGCGDLAAARPAAISPPELGGAALEEPPVPPTQPPMAKTAPPSARAAKASAPAQRKGGAGLILAFLSVLLLIVGGVAAYVLIHPPMLAPKGTPVTPAAASHDRELFEAALGAAPCSSLQFKTFSDSTAGSTLTVSGVAQNPEAMSQGLNEAAKNAGATIANLDATGVQPAPASLCPLLEALRPFRAETSVTGALMTPSQSSFDIMSQVGGAQAARAVIGVDKPPAGADLALVQLGADGALTVIAPSRQALDALAAKGGAVAAEPDGGYGLQVDYPKPGLSALILLTGKGPFDPKLIAPTAAGETAAWATQFAVAARAGGWKAEVVWYEVAKPSTNLNMTPTTEAPPLSPSNALIPPTPGSQPGKTPPAGSGPGKTALGKTTAPANTNATESGTPAPPVKGGPAQGSTPPPTVTPPTTTPSSPVQTPATPPASSGAGGSGSN